MMIRATARHPWRLNTARRLGAAQRLLRFHTFGALRYAILKKDAPGTEELENVSRTSHISRVLRDSNPASLNLLAPVNIAEDPSSVLKSQHPASRLLTQSALVVTREMEMMNVMLGYEEANKYVILDAEGNHLGFMAEEDHGMGRMLVRQLLRTHRSFTTHIFDRHMREILRFHRPFSYINSNIGVYDPLGTNSSAFPSGELANNLRETAISASTGQIDPQTSHLPLSDMSLIGEAAQVWAPLRRKYDLFLRRPPEDDTPTVVFEQFARVDEPFLSWDFALRDSNGGLIGSISRNFTNLGRELFTDAGVYALRMDAAAAAANSMAATDPREDVLGNVPPMTLDQRAVMLATAVTIDYDYFSRERGGMFGGMPLWFSMGGGTTSEAGTAGAAGAGAAGEIGAAEGAATAGSSEVAGTAAGSIARGTAGGLGGISESAVTSAGTMAAYEAMQRAREEQAAENGDISPVPNAQDSSQVTGTESEVPWWEQDQAQQREQNPWDWNDEVGGSSGGGGDGSGGGDGGGGGSDWGDFF